MAAGATARRAGHQRADCTFASRTAAAKQVATCTGSRAAVSSSASAPDGNVPSTTRRAFRSRPDRDPVRSAASVSCALARPSRQLSLVARHVRRHLVLSHGCRRADGTGAKLWFASPTNGNAPVRGIPPLAGVSIRPRRSRAGACISSRRCPRCAAALRFAPRHRWPSRPRAVSMSARRSRTCPRACVPASPSSTSRCCSSSTLPRVRRAARVAGGHRALDRSLRVTGRVGAASCGQDATAHTSGSSPRSRRSRPGTQSSHRVLLELGDAREPFSTVTRPRARAARRRSGVRPARTSNVGVAASEIDARDGVLAASRPWHRRRRICRRSGAVRRESRDRGSRASRSRC